MVLGSLCLSLSHLSPPTAAFFYLSQPLSVCLSACLSLVALLSCHLRLPVLSCLSQSFPTLPGETLCLPLSAVSSPFLSCSPSPSSPDFRSVLSSILLPLSSLCLSTAVSASQGGPLPAPCPSPCPLSANRRELQSLSGDPSTLGCQGTGAQEGLRAHYPNGICGGRPASLGNGPLKPSGANGGLRPLPPAAL